jgi:hypothetical protein
LDDIETINRIVDRLEMNFIRNVDLLDCALLHSCPLDRLSFNETATNKLSSYYTGIACLTGVLKNSIPENKKHFPN